MQQSPVYIHFYHVLMDQWSQRQHHARRTLKLPSHLILSRMIFSQKDINAATEDNTDFLQLVFSGTYEEYSSSELQIWDVLDLYIPESFSSMQFNTSMGFANDECTSYYECVDAVDMAERNISPPSIDKTMDAEDTELRGSS